MLHVPVLGDVHLEADGAAAEMDDLIHNLGHPLRVAVGHHDVGSLAGHCEGGGAADAAGAAGDYRDFAGEFHFSARDCRKRAPGNSFA